MLIFIVKEARTRKLDRCVCRKGSDRRHWRSISAWTLFSLQQWLFIYYGHRELGMNRELIRVLKQNGVRLMTASDAHRPEDVGRYIKEAEGIMREGYAWQAHEADLLPPGFRYVPRQQRMQHIEIEAFTILPPMGERCHVVTKRGLFSVETHRLNKSFEPGFSWCPVIARMKKSCKSWLNHGHQGSESFFSVGADLSVCPLFEIICIYLCPFVSICG